MKRQFSFVAIVALPGMYLLLRRSFFSGSYRLFIFLHPKVTIILNSFILLVAGQLAFVSNEWEVYKKYIVHKIYN